MKSLNRDCVVLFLEYSKPWREMQASRKVMRSEKKPLLRL